MNVRARLFGLAVAVSPWTPGFHNDGFYVQNGHLAFSPVSRTVPHDAVDEISFAWTNRADLAGTNPYDFQGFPAVAQWQTGNYKVQVNVTASNADLTYKLQILRVDRTGVIQETIGTSSPLSGTGVQSFTVSAYTPAAGANTDRLQVRLLSTNANHTTAHTLTLTAAVTDSYIEAPFQPAAWALTSYIVYGPDLNCKVCNSGSFFISGNFYTVMAVGSVLYLFTAAAPDTSAGDYVFGNPSPGVGWATWTLVDTKIIAYGINRMDAILGNDGVTIEVVLDGWTAAATGFLRFYQATASGWSVTDEQIATLSADVSTGGGTGDIRASAVRVVERSNSHMIAAWGDGVGATNNHQNKVYYSERTAVNTWSAPVEVSSITGSELMSLEHIILGASDRVHFVYQNGLTTTNLKVYHRSLDNTDTLDTQAVLVQYSQGLRNNANLLGGLTSCPVLDGSNVVLGFMGRTDISSSSFTTDRLCLVTYPDTANPTPVVTGINLNGIGEISAFSVDVLLGIPGVARLAVRSGVEFVFFQATTTTEMRSSADGWATSTQVAPTGGQASGAQLSAPMVV